MGKHKNGVTPHPAKVQPVRVKLLSDSPNAILVCKQPSTRATGTGRTNGPGLFDGTTTPSISLRTKGNYIYTDVELDPELPTNVYTNLSLVSFTKTYVDQNIDGRVFLWTHEAWDDYENRYCTFKDVILQLLLCPIMMCSIVADPEMEKQMFGGSSPFKWATNQWNKIKYPPNLKFVLAEDEEN